MKRTNNKYKLKAETLLKYHDIMQLYVNGLTLRDAALMLDMPVRTIEHISFRLLDYYNVTHLGQLVAVLIRKGIVK